MDETGLKGMNSEHIDKGIGVEWMGLRMNDRRELQTCDVTSLKN